MKGFSFLAILTAFFAGQNSCSGRVPLNPFPLGTIGCLVSDVCGGGEVCTNDLLFGSCQNIFSRALSGDIKFHLERGEIFRLEKEIKKLIKDGFTWKDAFTQCAIQNTLVEFSRGRLFNPKKCEDALGVTSTDIMDDMNEEIASVLLKLLENGDINLGDLENISAQDESEGDQGMLNSNKRDEIVQVHKYFDKSTGQLKRDPLSYQDPSSSYFYIPSDDDTSPIDDRLADALYANSPQPRESSMEEEASDFPVFRTEADEDQSSDDGPSPASFGEAGEESSDMLTDDQSRAMLAEQLGLGQDMEDSFVPDDSAEDDAMVLEGEEALGTPSTDTVSQQDEMILEQLIDGNIKPEDLAPEQQQRMHVFIEKLIKVLDNESPQPTMESVEKEEKEEKEKEKEEGEEKEGPAPDLKSDEEGEAPEEEEEENKEELPPPEVETRGVEITPNDAEKRDGDDESKETVHLVIPAEGEKDSGYQHEGSEDTLQDRVEHINPNSMYLVLSEKLDEDAGYMFVRNLTKDLELPPDVFVNIGVGTGNLISLDLNPLYADRYDAESIVRKAIKHKTQLEWDTGISVVKAVLGEYGNGVEFKENNRYVVLTFILVGSIAGVMLAVVTIYLIKRHTRSKQKLTQMASNPDGTEVSKDYQDLCRQRMQGKTSEKPEPLHAASRIGSASEGQVRSPSSRSSTSSWSEEPAATNMDISTGHIVLSYMEDHLKNQNRLDKEWEAVSSYVADPSSTKVATDQSNTRKNRFADILPYDHSRVVLSSNANVANSDFVNANFITDHDPRNPAYICTQGPLPHTVADFWQMIWEQGSVVIVMLTKLAENGTSLCHRYWPEEGSDLYHIYEVHLVSEHIWSDDYLVRSFYLKNLQTNETRTVTQFHFLTWPQLSIPASIKTLLDFRRKVNKSFRGRSCPIVVHCSDGCGRSGTYCLIDMVLNKMAKGAKEIDMAATLEHIRDQRMCTVKTKEQFQFSLAAVAEEVHAILKALPQ